MGDDDRRHRCSRLQPAQAQGELHPVRRLSDLRLALLAGACAASPAVAAHSDSSIDTFIAVGGRDVGRVHLIGEPSQARLDTLLPATADAMYRFVLSCRIGPRGEPRHCIDDAPPPFTSPDIRIIAPVLRSVRLSDTDRRRATGPTARLRIVIYLDDPRRAIDRRNPWAIPTPAPPSG